MAVYLLAFLALLGPAHAFPTIFVARYAKECTDHPYADFGKVHEYSKTPDTAASFSLSSQTTGKSVGGTACAGDSYNLQVTFGAPSVRNYLLTTTHGSLSADNNDCDPWCENRVCSKSPVPQGKAVLKVPCDVAAGTQVTVKVTSANGRTPTPGSTLRSNTLSFTVEGSCPGKCSGSSSSSSSSDTSKSSSSSSDSSSSSKGGGSAVPVSTNAAKKVAQKAGQ